MDKEARERKRLKLIERDGDRCRWCGVTPEETAQGVLHIDHVVARINGGHDGLDNLQLLCPSCNSKKGARDEDQPPVRHASTGDQMGFTMIPNTVLLDTRLSLAARVMYGALKYFAWSNIDCFPGQKRLSDMLGVSERSVRDYINELVDAKLIRTEKRGFGKTNLYVILNIARLELPADSAAHAAEVSAQSGSVLPVSTGTTVPPKKTQEERNEIQMNKSDATSFDRMNADRDRRLAEEAKAPEKTDQLDYLQKLREETGL